MKKYLVSQTMTVTLRVEANSKHEAIELAKDMGIAIYGDIKKTTESAKIIKES